MGQGSTALSTPKLGRMWNSVGMGASLKYQTSTDILYSQNNTDTDRQTDTQICRKNKEKSKQAGAELGQAQVKLDDIFEVVVDVVVIAVVLKFNY